MKRILCLICAFALLMSLAAMAEGGTVVCVNCTVNGQTRAAFDGEEATFTAIADDLENPVVWKVNGQAVEGENRFYLVFTVKGNAVVEAVKASDEPAAPEPTAETTPVPETTPEPAPEPAEEKPPVVIKAIGATLQYLNGDGIGDGQTYTELDFTEDYRNPLTGRRCKGGVAAFKVTADNPHSDAIDYWVFNGVRYNFMTAVRFITVGNLKESLTIEVVYKNKKSTTRLTQDEIQAARTGEQLIVKGINAKVSLVKNNYTRIGPYYSSIDFTEDYKNPETHRTIKGGSIDAKIVANIDTQKLEKVTYWSFNQVTVVLGSNVNTFSVHGLNRSMTYTAHIGTKTPHDYGIELDDDWYNWGGDYGLD
ncbi:MAG: hypothetical protein IKX84_02880 [Clostridia bacterium]|nr:hypothetical protein [Clostridia bacterium]